MRIFSVEDLKINIEQTISNPFLYAQLARFQKDNIDTILATAAPPGKQKKPAKRKRAAVSSEGLEPPPEAVEFRKQLDGFGLKCWTSVWLLYCLPVRCLLSFSYPPTAASFIRAPRNSDVNVIAIPVCKLILI